MGKYSVDEKLKYNNDKPGLFSAGYVVGVTSYRDYSKADSKYRKTIRELIDTSSAAAKNGEEFSKGVMCGVRDAANERKSRVRRHK